MFSFKKVPVFSFSPFKTGDNPAIIQDEKISQICAHLYASPYKAPFPPSHYQQWLGLLPGDKFSRETSWLMTLAHKLSAERLCSSEKKVLLNQQNVR